MHDSDRYLGEVLQKISVSLAFLLRNFEVQFLVLLKQVGKYNAEHGDESNNDFDHEQTSFCDSDGLTRPMHRIQRNSEIMGWASGTGSQTGQTAQQSGRTTAYFSLD